MARKFLLCLFCHYGMAGISLILPFSLREKEFRLAGSGLF